MMSLAFRVVAAGWTKPNAAAPVDRSRNVGIDREADELAAAVAELNAELARA
jgi:hypothetical protein